MNVTDVELDLAIEHSTSGLAVVHKFNTANMVSIGGKRLVSVPM